MGEKDFSDRALAGDDSLSYVSRDVFRAVRDQVKVVLCSRDDYEWTRDLLRDRAGQIDCDVLFSPSWGQVEPRDLAEWILADRLDVRLQVQLHKVLWGNEPGR